VWFKSRGRRGFEAPQYMPKGETSPSGPTLVFQSDAESLLLADMTGDGRTDLVQVRYGQSCYWPNKGHGRFGALVTRDNAPRFGHVDQSEPTRIRLADVDGSRLFDLI